MNIFTGTILVTLLIFVIGYPALVYFFCKGIDKLRERQKRELKLAKKYSVSYAIASEEFLQMMVAWAAYRDFVQGRPIEKWHILDRFFTSMMYDNAWENEFAHKIFSDWTEVFKRNYFRFYVAY
ncbi:MAG: hypothetical protein U9P90_03200, partial [Patescibacteria group bacterium]|nr:hypothetical protein [Patescibacteria group bacterium]